jgi:hypothetical protein
MVTVSLLCVRDEIIIIVDKFPPKQRASLVGRFVGRTHGRLQFFSHIIQNARAGRSLSLKSQRICSAARSHYENARACLLVQNVNNSRLVMIL